MTSLACRNREIKKGKQIMCGLTFTWTSRCAVSWVLLLRGVAALNRGNSLHQSTTQHAEANEVNAPLRRLDNNNVQKWKSITAP